MSDALGKIALYAAISVVVGAIASRAGRKKARAILAGDQAALDSLPKVEIPVPPTIPEALAVELQESARAAASQGGWGAACRVYVRAMSAYPKRSPEWRYLESMAKVFHKLDSKLKVRVALAFLGLCLAWGACLVAYLKFFDGSTPCRP